MPNLLLHAFGAIVLALGPLPLASSPLPFASGTGQLDEARQHADALRSELEELTQHYERTVVAVELASEEFQLLQAREQHLAGLADELSARLGERARHMFKHGSTGMFDALLAAQQPATAVQRASLFATVQHREHAGLEEALAVEAALDQTRAVMRDQQRRLNELEGELALAAVELQQQLDDAEVMVTSLETMRDRQRRIDDGVRQGLYACPLDPHLTHFIDSWGHPRSGGRAHRGTDVMGPMGAPVYAFTDGVIERHHNSRLGGISLYLRGEDGATYFYTHLQGYAPGGSVGNRVSAGEHIAYNGNTGNAVGGAPHIHFERHPGGGAAENPYPWLAAACF